MLNSDLDEHFTPESVYNYIFSNRIYPRASVIQDTSSKEIMMRSSTDANNYIQLRINNTGVYADWIESGVPTVTKTIATKA